MSNNKNSLKKYFGRRYFAVLAVGTAMLLGGFVFLKCTKGNSSHQVVDSTAGLVNSSSSESRIKSLTQLLVLTPDRLEQIDIGLMNLLCAQGLAESENLNLDACLARLDEWAQKVKLATDLRINAFHQNPAKYDNSENICRMVNLVLTLKE